MEGNEGTPAPKRRGPPPGFRRASPHAPKEVVSEVAVQVEPEVDTTADGALAGAESKTDRQTYLEEIERIRSVRKPFGTFTQKLALPVRPGYHRHWFNDVPGRVDEKKAEGWTHVTDDKGKPVRRVVGSGRDKGALYAFAMEIPSVFWEEDQAAKLAAARAQIDALKAQPFQAKPGQARPQDNEKFYSPRDEVLSVTKS